MSGTRETLFFTYRKWFGGDQETRELRYFWVISLITLGISLFIAVFLGMGLWAAYRSCQVIGIETGVETAWHVFGGCFLDLGNGTKAPVDEDSIGVILRYLIEQGQ